jgi:hypothetical protein
VATWWDYRQRQRRRWRRWRRSIDDRLEAWRAWWERMSKFSDISEVRMDVDGQVEVGMGKVLAGQLHQQALHSIKAAVRAELLEEVKAEALELAKAELEETLTRRRERLLDETAKYKAQLEDELQGELDRQRERLQQEVGDAWQEKYLTLKDQRDEARTARDRAEAVLVSLVKQLLPGEKPVYLYSAGVRELDRGQLNATLARHGLQVKSRPTYSERLVTVRLDQGRAVGHTQFWLTPVLQPGVKDEDGAAEA